MPSHGFLFGYRADQTWNEAVHVVPRLVRQFDEDNGDGMREDDLYGLTHVPFQFGDEDLKKVRKHLYLWYHPDKCKQRAIIERKHNPSYEYPQSDWGKAARKWNWRLDAMRVLENLCLHKFWNFHMRRTLGLVDWFMTRIPVLVKSWRKPIRFHNRGFFIRADDPNARLRMQ